MCTLPTPFETKHFLPTICLLRSSFYEIVDVHGFTGSVIKWNLLYKCCMYNGPNIPLFYEKFVWNCRCALFYWVHYKSEFYCINVALITDPILITIFHGICWRKYRTQKMFQKLVTTYLCPGNVCVHYFALLPDNTYFSLRCLL